MDWAEQMRDQLNGQADAFSKRLAEELSGLVKSLDVVIGGKRIFHDNKNEYFRFMPVQATGQLDDDNVEYFGDVYTAKFLASFAQVAQEQRHRTLRVKINFVGDKPGNMVIMYRNYCRNSHFKRNGCRILPESQSSSRREC